MVKELPISTDPYEQSAEPHPDRLGQGDSKTPLMTGGSSGKLRILVLMGLAAIFFHKQSKVQVLTDPTYGDLKFPSESRIYGSRQTTLGGGATPFGAVAVYVKMTPQQVRSPPSAEWAQLDAFAALPNGITESSSDSFFSALAASETLERSLLLQFDGSAAALDLFNEIDTALSPALGLPGTASVVSALQGAMKDPATAKAIAIPVAGAQLYVTCDRHKAVHVAYGSPAKVGVRNTAPVSSTLSDGEVPDVCRNFFAAMLGQGGPASAARAGVAAGFTAQYGSGANANEEKSEL